MQEAKLYLVQFAEEKPSEFFKHTQNEVVFGKLDNDNRELYITSFLGRGDLVNKNGIVITNESIPKYENRWLGALHVLIESGKHIPYYLPKNIAMSAMEMELFFKSQAFPHSIGKYVDAFHITDEIGIHNLYGTYKTLNPLAIQKWIEKAYPRFTSSSLMVNKRDSERKITDWTPIDNTSVHKPAYPMALSEIVDSCSCISGNKGGSSCVSKLRTSTNEKKKMVITVAQSSVEHAAECIEKGFENNKNYFVSDNAHYQFLAQSSIMSQNEGDAGAAKTSTGAEGSEAGSEGSQQSKNTQNLGQVLLNKSDNPGNASEMSKFNFESNPGEGNGQKGEGEGKPEGDQKPDKTEDTNSVGYWKAKYEGLQKQVDEEIAPKLKGYDDMKTKFDANERRTLIANKVNELGKGKLSEERRAELINHYVNEFNSVADLKQLGKLIDTQFEMLITPKVKQSGESVDEISNRFLAKDNKVEQSEEKPKNNRFIDVTKAAGYIP